VTKALLSKRFREAAYYAADLHAEQVRKGTTIPYLAHLLAVASLVLEHGGNEVEAIAALLHDAIEDQGKGGEMRRQIGERFGPVVLAIVEGCTDAEGQAGETKPAWKPRKEAYIAHVRTASPSIRLVSAADKLHNARAILSDLRSLGDGLWSRFSGGKMGSLWYYRALVGAFRDADADRRMENLVDELDRTVTEIELLARTGAQLTKVAGDAEANMAEG
jgi:(p)ppGpp synthase/HD superfamily hydrolase